MKIANIWSINKVVDKESCQDCLTTDVGELFDSPELPGVTHNDIPINLTGLGHIRFTKVESNTVVEAHSHPSPTFRFIMDGDLTIENKTYKKGDWLTIPPNYEYSIKTKDGYTSFWICGVCTNKTTRQ